MHFSQSLSAGTAVGHVAGWASFLLYMVVLATKVTADGCDALDCGYMSTCVDDASCVCAAGYFGNGTNLVVLENQKTSFEGSGIDTLGDIDGNGVNDYLLGSYDGSKSGELFVLLMEEDGSVKENALLASGNDGDFLGSSIACLGDLTGNGFPDCAVGAHRRDTPVVYYDDVIDSGAVLIYQFASATSLLGTTVIDGSRVKELEQDSYMGWRVANVGDINGDGVPDLATCAFRHGEYEGALVLIYLKAGALYKSHTFMESGLAYSYFGFGLAAADLNGDSVQDLIVGAPYYRCDDRPFDGSVQVLLSNPSSSTSAAVTFSSAAAVDCSSSGFHDVVAESSFFGWAVEVIGDWNADGIPDIVVSALTANQVSGIVEGSLFVVALWPTGELKSLLEISASSISSTASGIIGHSLSAVGDVNEDGLTDLFVYEDGSRSLVLVSLVSVELGCSPCAFNAVSEVGSLTSASCACNAGYSGVGSTLCEDINECLNGTHSCPSTAECENTEGGYQCLCMDGYGGVGLECHACVGNASSTLASGAVTCTCDAGFTGDGFVGCEDIDECALEMDNCVSSAACENVLGSFTCTCKAGFSGDATWPEWLGEMQEVSVGMGVEMVGDMDWNGTPDLLAGVILADMTGAVFAVLLNADGSLSSVEQLLAGDDNDFLGSSIACMGDLTADGMKDCAVGAFQRDGAGLEDSGAVFLMDIAGGSPVRVENTLEINANEIEELQSHSHFGWRLTAVGDTNKDGIVDIAASAYRHNDFEGAVVILSIGWQLTFKGYTFIQPVSLAGTMSMFGFGLSAADIDGNGYKDLLVGAPAYDAGIAIDSGAIVVITLSRGAAVMEELALYSADSADFAGHIQTGDFFGWDLLAVGDVDGNGVDDIVVSLPMADVASYTDAGALYLLFLESDGSILEWFPAYAPYIFPGSGSHTQLGFSLDATGNWFPGAHLTLFMSVDHGRTTYAIALQDVASGCAACPANAMEVYGACSCNTGYSGDGLSNCVDIDECTSGLHDCGHNTTMCTNNDGSFSCACLTGYGGDWDSCLPCADNAATVQDSGSGLAFCECSVGFDGDGLVGCDDVDECLTGLHTCSVFSYCFNSVGSFSCSCIEDHYGTGVASSFVESSEFAVTGNSIASVGDVNSDGFADYVVGTVLSAEDSGTAAVVAGSKNGALGSMIGPIGSGEEAGAQFGFSTDCYEDAQGLSVCGVGAPGSNAVYLYQVESTTPVLLSVVRASDLSDVDDYSSFGWRVSALPDANGDGHPDLAVSAPEHASYDGAVVLLFLGANATYTDHRLLTSSKVAGGRVGVGLSVHDLDRDGVTDIVVGAPFHRVSEGGEPGVVFGFLLNADSSVKAETVSVSMPPTLEGYFGWDVVMGPDVDDNGYEDVIVSTLFSGSTSQPSALVLLLMESAGEYIEVVLYHPESPVVDYGYSLISDSSSMYVADSSGSLYTLTLVSNVDRSCFPCGAYANAPVGSTASSACACNEGYHGSATAGCKDTNECSEGFHNCLEGAECINTAGSFSCECEVGYGGNEFNCTACSKFANSVETVGGFMACECLDGYAGDGYICSDVDECMQEPFVCDPYADCVNVDGSFSCTCAAGYGGGGGRRGFVKTSSFFGTGTAMEPAGDLNADGVEDFLLGEALTSSADGAVSVLLMKDSTTVLESITLLAGAGNEGLGSSIVCLGDLDGNGYPECAIGAFRHATGSVETGGIYLVRMDSASVLSHTELVDGTQISELSEASNAGWRLAGVGDIDGNGVPDVATGAYRYNSYSGAVVILFLQGSGDYMAHTLVSPTDTLGVGTRFGMGLAAADLNADGLLELLVGAPAYNGGTTTLSRSGALLIMELGPDGQASDETVISAETAELSGHLSSSGYFGWDVAVVGDLDEDGLADVAVSAPWNPSEHGGDGSLYVLLIAETGGVKEVVTTAFEEDGVPLHHPGYFISSAGFRDSDSFGDLLVGLEDGSVYLVNAFLSEGCEACDEHARSGPSSLECICNDGFVGTGYACDDADECAAATHSCSTDANCTNTYSSFTCMCHDGYAGAGVSCNRCHENAVSISNNTACSCIAGFSGDGLDLCQDIDECSSGAHNCHAQSACVNSVGSFQCSCSAGQFGNGVECAPCTDYSMSTSGSLEASDCVCNIGYEGGGDSSCEDYDECAREWDTCSRFAICQNTNGSFSCECDLGYVGDGMSCMGGPSLEVAAIHSLEDLPVPLLVTPYPPANADVDSTLFKITISSSTSLQLVTFSGLAFTTSAANGGIYTLSASGTGFRHGYALDGWSIDPAVQCDVDFTLGLRLHAESTSGLTVSDFVDLPVSLGAVADVPSISVQPSLATSEDEGVAVVAVPLLPIDTDKSETVKKVLARAIPEHPMSFDSTSYTGIYNETEQMYTLEHLGSGFAASVKVAGWNVQPMLHCDSDFSFSVRTLARESNGGDEALSSWMAISVAVTAVADMQAVEVVDAITVQDRAFPVFVTPWLVEDTDGSESIWGVAITGAAGLIYSDGKVKGVGSAYVAVGSDDFLPSGVMLQGLSVSPPVGCDTDFTLSVQTLSQEAAEPSVYMAGSVSYMPVELAPADGFLAQLTSPTSVDVTEAFAVDVTFKYCTLCRDNEFNTTWSAVYAPSGSQNVTEDLVTLGTLVESATGSLSLEIPAYTFSGLGALDVYVRVCREWANYCVELDRSLVIASCIRGSLTLPSSSGVVSRASNLAMELSLTSTCAKAATKFTYSWSTGVLDPEPVTRTTTIPKYTLEIARSYTFSVFACVRGTHDCIADAETVWVKSSALVATIAGGSGSHSMVNDLVLDGSGSYDPDGYQLSYDWSCSTESTDLTALENCAAIIRTSAVLTISAFHLPAGVYSFVLVVSQSGREASAAVDITIVSESTPSLAIDGADGVVPFDEKLTLSAVASSDAGGSLAYSWSQVVTADTSHTVDLTGDGVLTALSSPWFVLEAYTLLEATEYTFRVEVSDVTGTSWKEVTFTTSSTPEAGPIAVAPVSGCGLDTLFYFEAVNWTDASGPLEYRFSSRSGGVSRYLTDWQYAPFVETTLSGGLEEEGYAVEVIVNARSPYATRSGSAGYVTVTWCTNDLAYASEQIAEAQERAEATDDVDVALNALQQAADYLNNVEEVVTTPTESDGIEVTTDSHPTTHFASSQQTTFSPDATLAPTSGNSTPGPISTQEPTSAGSAENFPSVSESVAAATAVRLEILSALNNTLSAFIGNKTMGTVKDRVASLVAEVLAEPGEVDESVALSSLELLDAVVREGLSVTVDVAEDGTLSRKSSTSSSSSLGSIATDDSVTLSTSAANDIAKSVGSLIQSLGGMTAEAETQIGNRIGKIVQQLGGAMATTSVPGEAATCAGQTTAGLIVASQKSARDDVASVPSASGKFEVQSCSGDTYFELPPASLQNSLDTQLNASSFIHVLSVYTSSPYPVPADTGETLASSVVGLSIVDSVSFGEVRFSNLQEPLAIGIPLLESEPEVSGMVTACVYWDDSGDAWSTFGCTSLPNPRPIGTSISWIEGFDFSNETELNLAWNIDLEDYPGCFEMDPAPRTVDGVAWRAFVPGDGEYCQLMDLSAGCFWNVSTQAFVGPDCVFEEDEVECRCNHLTDFGTLWTPPIPDIPFEYTIPEIAEVKAYVTPLAWSLSLTLAAAICAPLLVWRRKIASVSLMREIQHKRYGLQKFPLSQDGREVMTWTLEMWRDQNHRLAGPGVEICRVLGIPVDRVLAALPRIRGLKEPVDVLLSAVPVGLPSRNSEGEQGSAQYAAQAWEEIGEKSLVVDTIITDHSDAVNCGPRFLGTALMLAYLSVHGAASRKRLSGMIDLAEEYFCDTPLSPRVSEDTPAFACGNDGETLDFRLFVEQFKVLLFDKLLRPGWRQRASLWKLVTLQAADGFWDLNENLAEALRVPTVVFARLAGDAETKAEIAAEKGSFGGPDDRVSSDSSSLSDSHDENGIDDVMMGFDDQFDLITGIIEESGTTDRPRKAPALLDPEIAWVSPAEADTTSPKASEGEASGVGADDPLRNSGRLEGTLRPKRPSVLAREEMAMRNLLKNATMDLLLRGMPDSVLEGVRSGSERILLQAGIRRVWATALAVAYLRLQGERWYVQLHPRPVAADELGVKWLQDKGMDNDVIDELLKSAQQCVDKWSVTFDVELRQRMLQTEPAHPLSVLGRLVHSFRMRHPAVMWMAMNPVTGSAWRAGMLLRLLFSLLVANLFVVATYESTAEKCCNDLVSDYCGDDKLTTPCPENAIYLLGVDPTCIEILETYGDRYECSRFPSLMDSQGRTEMALLAFILALCADWMMTRVIWPMSTIDLPRRWQSDTNVVAVAMRRLREALSRKRLYVINAIHDLECDIREPIHIIANRRFGRHWGRVSAWWVLLAVTILCCLFGALSTWIVVDSENTFRGGVQEDASAVLWAVFGLAVVIVQSRGVCLDLLLYSLERLRVLEPSQLEESFLDQLCFEQDVGPSAAQDMLRSVDYTLGPR